MRSNSCKTGLERAPHRSLFKALGLTDEEMKRPLIGIVNARSEVVRDICILIRWQRL